MPRVRGHPAFPTPSLGGRLINGSGASRREVANVCLGVIASEAKQSIAPQKERRKDGLLRCARNDGRGFGLLRGACHRIRATRWLAMTALLRATEATAGTRPFSPTTSWVVNLRREQLLTFGDTIAISTPPGTTSGLLPLDGICG